MHLVLYVMQCARCMLRGASFNMLYLTLYYNVCDTSVGSCMRYKIRACVYMYEIHGEINTWHDSFNFKIGFKIKLKRNIKIEPF